MATNLGLDDNLIEEARKVGGHKSKKAAVTAALDEYIRRHKQQQVSRLFSTLDFDPTYDYKTERRARKA